MGERHIFELDGGRVSLDFVNTVGGKRGGAEASWIWRDTNFPDYVPNVFPATRQYSIDWDYKNLSAVAGVSVRY